MEERGEKKGREGAPLLHSAPALRNLGEKVWVPTPRLFPPCPFLRKRGGSPFFAKGTKEGMRILLRGVKEEGRDVHLRSSRNAPDFVRGGGGGAALLSCSKKLQLNGLKGGKGFFFFFLPGKRGFLSYRPGPQVGGVKKKKV